ncbi:hypothetical protein BH09BAC2_BH09BAC2_12140 [soil metagenome]
MYLIISATNRHDSYTEKVAKEYQRLFKEENIDAQILSLVNLDVLQKNEKLTQTEQQFLIPAEKIIFIMPEYNGSYPGVLKALIDISDVRKCWWHKKALLTGVSTGRAGNLRGMEHITGVLNHMKVIVHPNKLPLSGIDTLIDEFGSINNAPALMSIKQQLNEFIKF